MPGHARYRRWEFQLQPGETCEDMVRPERLWSLLSPWMGPQQARIVRSVVYRFHATVAASMRSGSVFLASDAAHQMPPFLGQGLCSGMRDAANLAWKLACVRACRADDRLLDTYDVERRPHSTAMVAYAADAGRLIDQLAGRVDLAVSTDAGYGGGRPYPHLTEGFLVEGHPLVGRQLPQPMLGGRPLDELLGDGFALVRRDGEPEPCGADVLDAAMVRVEGPVLDAMWVPAGAVVIVRPDRSVAAVAATDDDLAAAIGRLAALSAPTVA